MSSGIPLEFEVAKLLGNQGFSITSDYLYSRDDSGLLKDFSVDIRATRLLSDENLGRCDLILLVECKYRIPASKWLFLPAPREEGIPNARASTLRLISEFSPLYPLKMDTASTHVGLHPAGLDRQDLICYKGVEINLSSGDVYDKEIKHGISQLQYALPRLITESIQANVTNASIDPKLGAPFSFMPILITTADIYVAKPGLVMKDVEGASDIDEIASKSNYVTLLNDCGPDFERHALKECQSLLDLVKTEYIKGMNQRIEQRNEHRLRTPVQVIKGIMDSDRYSRLYYFTSFLICNHAYLPTLLRRLVDYIIRV